MNEDHLKTWIGRREAVREALSPTPLMALQALLDAPPTEVQCGALLPPLAHWLHFLPLHRQSEVGADGHPQRGGFLPPVPLPRRMWAGGQLQFGAPLRVGDEVQRTSCIADVAFKAGRTGALVFVKVRHELQCNGAQAPALVEVQDLVYRDERKPGDADPPAVPAPQNAAWQRRVVPDPVLLFRFSALTFNGHRIHYDRPYAQQAEGYPGLVVHGPLIATLLIDLLRREMPRAEVAAFGFKAVRPLFDLHPFTLAGRPEADGRTVRLWAQDHEGALAMDSTATLH